MSDKSKVISARLNPQFEQERKALEIFEQWVSEGFTPREIMTNAILNAAQFKPEMFRERGARGNNLGEIIGTLESLRDSLVGDIKSVMQEMWRSNPQQFRSMVNEAANDSADIELDDEFIANAVQSLRPTYRKSKGDE